MATKLLTAILVLGIGLMIVIGPYAASDKSGSAAIGNCYSDSETFSTPTLCE
jgi:hypothetical protein